MSAGPETQGKSRTCPHCRATILESASICPVCRHHLRFNAREKPAVPSFSPLRVEGTISHPDVGGPWEYSVLLVIRDENGRELGRQVVGVGGLWPGEQRTCVLEVEVFTPAAGENADLAVGQAAG